MVKYISMSIYIALDLCDDSDQEFWLNIYCSDEFKNFIKKKKEKQKQERCGYYYHCGNYNIDLVKSNKYAITANSCGI